MPVSGECRPAIPRACGSSSSMPAASIRRRPGTPLALPRRSSSSRRSSSEASVATITLPQRSCAMPRCVAVLVQLARALHAQARLQRAGHVVDAGVDHARSCGRSGACRARPRARARTPTPAGCGAISSRATARPTIPPPTIARSQRSGRRLVAGAGALEHRARRLPCDARRGRRARWPRPRRPGRRRTGVRRRRRRACARSRCRRAVICAGVGWRPSTPLAMISAAVAATCGVAIEVPS